jgi:cytochrome c biogenesis protein CcmG, thiol:disulfide interchange protein DsbE
MFVRRTLRIAVLCAITAIGACSGGASSGARSGQPVDASFKRFDGSPTSLAAYRGKPLLVNFFSSTCAPCRTEMPALENVHRALGDQMTFLGLDVQDTVEGGKAFIDTVGITWELGRDPNGDVLQSLVKAVGLPTTIVLDGEGRIAFSTLGPLDVGGLTTQLRDHHLIT